MRYAEFDQLIKQMAISASQAARRSFALDTIGLLHRSARDAINEEFTEPERCLLTEILADLERKPTEELKQKLEELNESQCRDPVRAIEFHPDVTQLLCAIDSWLDYRRTGAPKCIADIAINMVNSIDYAIGGDVGDYSINNMLGAPAMVAEHRRQQRLLVPGEPDAAPDRGGK